MKSSAPHTGPWEDHVSFMDNPDYHKMADHLEVSWDDRRDSEVAEKISYLADWAKDMTKSDDFLTQAEAIKLFRNSLGYQEIGKEGLRLLYKYARLDQDRRRIEKEMELIKHEPRP